MKRIIFISLMNGTPWGGSEVQWFEMARWLSRRGHRVEVVMFGREGNEARREELSEAGCSLKLMPFSEGKLDWKGKRRLASFLKNVDFEGADLCFVSQGGWSEVVHDPFVKLWKRMRKFVLIFHNYQTGKKLKFMKKRRLQAFSGAAYRNISDSKKLFDVLESSYGIEIPRQVPVCNPITFDPPESASPFPNDWEREALIMCVLAWLDVKRKSQDHLLRVLSSPKWKDRHWTLRLCGDGPDKELLNELAEEYGLQSKVDLPGNVAPQTELGEAHVFLQLTAIDSMPVSLVEAAAMARPILATKVGDMPLWVEDGVNGLLASDSSDAELDAVLERLWSSRSKLPEMGAQSFEVFKKRYPDPYVPELLERAGLGDLL
ncbi:glycosyltransferase family 4 protein [Haloferula chungangensis]|uniref:Glycosyltransferase family 4 protein n=1 Tax=Haloferula chungangensis TaxID=1048331 RepID=A0ABW2L2L8_9BACT